MEVVSSLPNQSHRLDVSIQKNLPPLTWGTKRKRPNRSAGDIPGSRSRKWSTPVQIKNRSDIFPLALPESKVPSKKILGKTKKRPRLSRLNVHQQRIPQTVSSNLQTDSVTRMRNFDLNVALGMDGRPCELSQSISTTRFGHSSAHSPLSGFEDVKDHFRALEPTQEAFDLVVALGVNGGVKQSRPGSLDSGHAYSQSLSDFQQKLMWQGMEPADQSLPAYRFPKGGLEEPTAKFFLKLMNKKLEEKCPKTGSLRKAEYQPFKRLPLRAYDWHPPNLNAAIPVSRPLDPKTQRAKTPSSLRNACKPLARWVTYIHLRLLARLKITNPEEQKNRCVNLFRWMLSEIFEPVGSPPPILGRLPKGDLIYDDKSFRPVQLELIKLLSHETWNDGVYFTSAAVVGIWYKVFHKNTWISHFSSDKDFWISMDSDIRKTIRSRNPLPDWNSEVPEAISTIDQFQLGALSEILKTQLPKRLRTLFQIPRNNMPFLGKGVDSQVTALLENVEKMFEKFPQRGTRRPKFICEGLPITIHPGQTPNEKDCIRLLRRSTVDVLNKEDLLGRLGRLLGWVNCIHETLQQSLSAKHPYQTKLPFNEFLAWFYKAAFEESSRSLPILGIGHFQDRVKIPENGNLLIAENENESFVRDLLPDNVDQFDFTNQFGELQIYMIKRLYKGITVPEFFQFSVSMLGYWYFTQNPRFSQRVFQGI
ncbi:hypothetical protein PGTUg99_029097 [Puccinia graminis f. sp. tritici]|uniref:Uncharacterized protein n=2 Tax=Puccinia graminis f. sp. tritici TaxID=56615 RepID=A0A5B0R683_PUCGR|nr:hypothetical protein PGTUg99_029097 [Puccinia graminis f. sp. tritici]